MRLLAGTLTVTGDPPPAGVSDSAETDTSKAITLSAGASPKRTWVETLPGGGVGVGPPAMAEFPPPPHPLTNATAASSMPETNNLVNPGNECLKVFFIVVSLLEGTKLFRGFELSQSAVEIFNFWLW
jgi:hypothetical protein